MTEETEASLLIEEVRTGLKRRLKCSFTRVSEKLKDRLGDSHGNFQERQRKDNAFSLGHLNPIFTQFNFKNPYSLEQSQHCSVAPNQSIETY